MPHGIPDQPPQPEGSVHLLYNPMQPAFYDLAHHAIQTYVYRDIETALAATRYWMSQIVAERPPEVSDALRDLPVTIFYRGQSEFAHRLLPTRLRGPRREVPKRVRVPLTVSDKMIMGLSGKPGVVLIPNQLYAAPAEIIDDVRRVQGNWVEHDLSLRDIDELVASLSSDVLKGIDRREDKAVGNAMVRFPEIAALDSFRRRAAIRHYVGVPSALLDVTSDIEVAAFFATGGERPAARNALGILWAIDLGMLFRYFEVSTRPVPGGYEVLIEDRRAEWGADAVAFAEQGIPPLSARLSSVELPLPRPVAQKAFFLELHGRDGALLTPRNEAIWWSLFERWAYPNGFVQSGRCYENRAAGVSSAALLPINDPFLALAIR